MKQCFLAVTFLLLFLISFSCTEGGPTVIALEYPLEKIEIWHGGDIYVKAASGVCLSDLIDLTPFLTTGFWPGISFQEAAEIHGPPDFKSHARQGRDIVYGYATDHGVIEIVRQLISSEGTEKIRWFLRFCIKDRIQIADKSILEQRKYFQDKQEEIRIKIFAGYGGDSVVDLDFYGQEIRYVWWKAQSVLDSQAESSEDSCIEEKIFHRG